MNFLEFDGQIESNQNSIQIGGAEVRVPPTLEDARGKLALGVRPEHVRFSDSGLYRGEVLATEYLGTTQIVTIATPNGTIKSRMSAAQSIKVGETPGLEFDARTVSLFNVETGQALLSQANQEVLRHG
jgi:multiple sugar transport system ATP-binding protein